MEKEEILNLFSKAFEILREATYTSHYSHRGSAITCPTCITVQMKRDEAEKVFKRARIAYKNKYSHLNTQTTEEEKEETYGNTKLQSNPEGGLLQE